MKPFDKVHSRIAPLRKSLLEHPIYSRVDCLDSLHVFMQHHVFAVWDFMSLLKALQQQLSCTQVPWLPPKNRLGCRLVNDIVLAEESDEDSDENGAEGFASHYDLYHDAMKSCGAETSVVDQFLEELRDGATVQQALGKANAPDAVSEFVLETFTVIDTGNLCAIASTFTFGREDLLPDLFLQIVKQLDLEANGSLKKFDYYLQRHIELDGEEHGPMAEKLIVSLCGESTEPEYESNWQVVEEAAFKSLEARLRLWDRVEASLSNKTSGLKGSRTPKVTRVSSGS